MKKTILFFTFLFLTGKSFAQEANFVPNEVLVQLEKGVDMTRIIGELSDVPIIDVKQVSKLLNIWQVRLSSSSISEDNAILRFYQNKDILVAQKNHKVKTRATVPDDVFFGQQWQYFQFNDRDIDVDEAWDVTTGGTTLNGNIIVTAVLDDGHDTNHEDFEDNIWINEAEISNNGVDDDQNGYVDDYLGWSTVTNDDDIFGGGHGTPVAGIIGAKGNNGIGVSGVNWDVKVMIIKNDFNTNEAKVIEAYSYALDARILYNQTNGAEGAFIVSTNASWGTDFGNPDNAPLWCSLYDTLGQNGILSCGATINGDYDVDVVGDLPTACTSEYLISVTNTDINDVKVTQAGYGQESIDLGAPGAGAFTTAFNNSYQGFGGTSGATPHVTGTIALLYSAPCQQLADLADSNPEIAAAIVRDLILDNVDPNLSLDGITSTGGRLNVHNAMQSLMNNCDSLLNINEFKKETNTINVYPNPSNDFVNISNTYNNTLESIHIYTLDGRLVKIVDTIKGNTININDLSNGAYIFKIKFKGSVTSYNKMIIKK
ncbi:S8 family peptidase [uncultured Winogradskyella sp.]|uniref:S8 family peptidase n=1 Tax=uncultured Winogradskyella sp. TaxID=395353 RepID=UPI00261FD9DE|nr:S8 family peptidase [uncultured Winogradskyella sp.]